MNSGVFDRLPATLIFNRASRKPSLGEFFWFDFSEKFVLMFGYIGSLLASRLLREFQKEIKGKKDFLFCDMLDNGIKFHGFPL